MLEYQTGFLEGADLERQAAGVAARGLRDNPSSLVISKDPLVRLQTLYDLFCLQMEDNPFVTVGGFVGRFVVAAAGVATPGHCIANLFGEDARGRPTPGPDASDLERAIFSGAVMAMHDLQEPHWHVGPVAVEPGLQGRGIGRAVMTVLCDDLDGRAAVAWLETDKPENVRFYLALGFEIAEEADLLHAHLWFMRREPM